MSNFYKIGEDNWRHKMHKGGAWIRPATRPTKERKYDVYLIDPWGNGKMYGYSSKKDARKDVKLHLSRWERGSYLDWR